MRTPQNVASRALCRVRFPKHESKNGEIGEMRHANCIVRRIAVDSRQRVFNDQRRAPRIARTKLDLRSERGAPADHEILITERRSKCLGLDDIRSSRVKAPMRPKSPSS